MRRRPHRRGHRLPIGLTNGRSTSKSPASVLAQGSAFVGESDVNQSEKKHSILAALQLERSLILPLRVIAMRAAGAWKHPIIGKPSYWVVTNNSGSFAILLAIRRASSFTT